MSYSKIILLFIILILHHSCRREDLDSSQAKQQNPISFEKTFGGNEDDYANSLLVIDGVFFIYGTTKSKNDINGDHYLIKVDSTGSLINESFFGSNSSEEGLKIIQTNDEHLFLLGWTKNTNSGNKDIHLIKTDYDGKLIWERKYGGMQDDFANDIIALANGDYLITGATTSYGEGSSDIYLIWIDPQGNVLKEVYHGDIDQDGGSKIIELADEDLMLFGYTSNYGAISRDYYLLKMTSTGDSLWSKRYGGDDYEEAQAFAQTSQGDFVLNGHSASTDPIHDMYGVKADVNGNLKWEKNFGGLDHDGGMAFLIDSEEHYVFVARSMSFAGNQNIYLVKTDESGQILQEKVIGLPKADLANEIIEYSGSYVLAGQSNSNSNGDLDIYLVRTSIDMQGA
jgi:hypothetical protein